jgi:hypothetical protein
MDPMRQIDNLIACQLCDLPAAERELILSLPSTIAAGISGSGIDCCPVAFAGKRDSETDDNARHRKAYSRSGQKRSVKRGVKRKAHGGLHPSGWTGMKAVN